MSRDSLPDLPDEIREAIEEETSEHADASAPSLDALWARLGSAQPPDDALPDAADTWTAVRRHLDAETDAADDPTRSREERAARSPRPRHRFRGRWAAAAVVVLIVALGAWWWQRPVTVTAEPGTTVTHTLPDGSTVELSGGARLAYARSYDAVAPLEAERRAVRVQGDAYFEVETAERPFVVRSATAQVEVTGTAFAVEADTGRTHVALAEGRVRVRGRTTTDAAVTLIPGEAVVVDRDGRLSPPADTSIERVTAWRRGGFAVTAQPLPAIAQRLEKQFGVPVALSAGLSRATTSTPLTLYYSQDIDVETILHDIAMARGLSYRSRAPAGYVLAPADRPSSSRDRSAQP